MRNLVKAALRPRRRLGGGAVLVVSDLVVEIRDARGVGRALDGVSFEAASGEILGLVGEAGAGKSTLIAAVLGLLTRPARIVSGEIRLGGVRIDNLPPERLRRMRAERIGYVPPDPAAALDPFRPIGAQLAETARAVLRRSPTQRQDRIRSALETAGASVEELSLDAYPRELAPETARRVALALATLAEPDLLLVDDPMRGLDISDQAQITAFLRRLRDEREVGVLLATQDLGIAAESADRAAVLYAGRIVENGPAPEVVGAPRHPYSVALRAATPAPFEDARPLGPIPGAAPTPTTRPLGCAFHPRCPRVFGPCERERPTLVRDGWNSVACWLYQTAAFHPAQEAAPHAIDDLSRGPAIEDLREADR